MTSSTLVRGFGHVVVDVSGGDKKMFSERLKAVKHFVEWQLPSYLRMTLVVPEGTEYYGSDMLQVVETTTPTKTAIEAVRDDPNSVLLTAGDVRKYVARADINKLMFGPELRPSLWSTFPAGPRTIIFGDLGGGVSREVEPMTYVALCGHAVARGYFGLDDVLVSLQNIGEESGKGGWSDLGKRLKGLWGENFLGNQEIHLLVGSRMHLLATDGVSGNNVIKAMDGVNQQTKFEVAQKCRQCPPLAPYYLANAAMFRLNFMGSMNWRLHNGAWLIGLRRLIIKGHGRSDFKGFLNALKRAASPETLAIWQAVEGDHDLARYIEAHGGDADGDEPTRTA